MNGGEKAEKAQKAEEPSKRDGEKSETGLTTVSL